MNSQLLFTHLEFFAFLKDWWFLILPACGGIYARYQWLSKRADELADQAKKERDAEKAEAKLEREKRTTDLADQVKKDYEKEREEAKKEREERALEAKKEREEQAKATKEERDKLNDLLKKHDERICKTEETQRNSLPQFKTLCDDFRKLEEVVKNHHETRFTGIVGNIELFGKVYDAKLDNANQRVNDLEKRLDKIDDKLDKIIKAVSKKKNKK